MSLRTGIVPTGVKREKRSFVEGDVRAIKVRVSLHWA